MKSMILAISIVVMSLYNTGQFNIIDERIIQPIQEEKADFFSLKNGVKYYYKGKDEEAVEIVENLLEELPDNVLIGVSEIRFKDKNEDIAGTACGSVITLYDFMSYSTKVQKDILYHEVRSYIRKCDEKQFNNRL